jgi:ectoine hydroxylase
MTDGQDWLREATTAYQRQGHCVPAARLSPSELDELRTAIERIRAANRPETVYEEDSDAVRALHGCHRYDDTCARLVRHPLLVDLAEALVGDSVYVYQFKVNVKSPRQGRRWPWHQDFAFWSIEDGMPAPDAVNLAISLDKVHEDNGPLTVLTGSHRHGLVGGDEPDVQSPKGSWSDHVSARLAHSIPDERAEQLLGRYPPHRLVGEAGSIAAFHPSIVHSSADNRSDGRRTMVFLTYNSVRNVPTHVTRPEFLVDRDTRPVTRASY